MIVFYILALLSEVAGTIGGFGSSVFFVPLASFFFEPKVVLGLTAFFHVFSNLAKLILFRKFIDKKIFLLFGLPSVIGVIIGGLLATQMSFYYAELMMGIFLVSFSFYFLKNPEVHFEASKKNAITGGTTAGFLAGLIGTGGAIRGAAMAAFNLEKNFFVGTSAAIDMGVDFSRSVIYWADGFINSSHLWYLPGLIIVSFLGSWIGKLLLNKISQIYFRKIVLILVGIIGIVSISKFFI
ncbi:MAG TPA: sulfite exporter TauE/SafE family protein [Bacteroidia bacterium]|jgi:uncharacterized membrane protein YfcA|nr:sulfite exporter TauE/SafE family protein [Bacteroidia bacterium]